MNCAYCRECDLVGDLMFGQEGASQTHQSVLEISRNIGIRRSSAGRIIPRSFQSHHNPEENNVPIVLSGVFSGSVATQLG